MGELTASFVKHSKLLSRNSCWLFRSVVTSSSLLASNLTFTVMTDGKQGLFLVRFLWSLPPVFTLALFPHRHLSNAFGVSIGSPVRALLFSIYSLVYMSPVMIIGLVGSVGKYGTRKPEQLNRKLLQHSTTQLSWPLIVTLASRTKYFCHIHW